MNKSSIAILPDHFDAYINLVDENNLHAALEKYGPGIFRREKARLESLGNMVYAPGKWTVKDILQHIIDTERIFAYRALRFARMDATPLPCYDENTYAVTAGAVHRNLDDLLEEFDLVRRSNIALYRSFNEAQLQSEGICFERKISVLAIGFTLAGHVIHHNNVLRERYFPMAQ